MRGIRLNPNATDADFDGLADGQELSIVEQALGDTVLGLTFIVLLDAFALYKELSGVSDVIHISGRGANFVRGAYPFLYPVTIAMNAIGVATAASDLAGDAGRLTRKLQEQ